MALEAFIAHYGLAAVFLGAAIEGEAAVITGGVLAHKGLLPVWGVAIAATAGSCLADQLWFWTSRHFRHARWVAQAQRRPAFRRAVRLLEHHLILYTLGFRFIYGMRTVTPIAIAASRIRTRTFVLLNLISAAAWGPIMTGLGYAFGRAINPWLHDMKSAVLVVIGAALAVASIVALTRSLMRRRAMNG